MFTPILKVSCQQYSNLVWFILWLIVVSKFVLIGWSFTKNLVFWNNFFKKTGTLYHLLITVLKHLSVKLFLNLPQLTTVEKKTLFLSLPYLGKISLQTRTKLRKSLKVYSTAVNLKLFLKAKGNSQMFSVSKIAYLSI